MTDPSVIISERRKLPVQDGTEMGAYAVRPKGPGPFPGMLVLQEAFGVNAHIRDVADRLAKEGWYCLAPELFHRTAPGFEAGYTEREPAFSHARATTLEGLLADVRAAHAALSSDPLVSRGDLSCIGFCLGGRTAFLAATELPFKAAISFYGSRIAPDLVPRAPDLSCPFLMLWGGKDAHIPPEQTRAVADALRSAGKPYVDVVFSQADHGFFCDARASYHPPSAKQAWALVLRFLESRS